MLDRKIILSAFLLAIGTYFHFLVTGWFVICLGIYWLYKKEFKPLIHFGISFILFITPLGIYLYETILKQSAHFINGINLNWAYCYGRLYHHLGIAISWNYLISKQLIGIITAFFVGLALIRLKHKIKELDFFSSLTIIAIALSLFFVLIALYDSFILDQYAIFPLKTYPFRPMALAHFFSFIITAAYLSKKVTYCNTKIILSLSLLTLFIAQGVKNYHNYSNSIKKTASFIPMMEHIIETTPKNSVFHLESLPHKIVESFIRKTERDAIYIHKFTPAESKKMYERCIIANELHEMNQNSVSPTTLKKKYNLEYIVSDKKLSIQDTKLIFSINNYFLYRINSL